MEAIGKKDATAALVSAIDVRSNIYDLRGKVDAKAKIGKVKRMVQKAVHAKKGVIEGDYQNALIELANLFGFSKVGIPKPPADIEGSGGFPSWRAKIAEDLKSSSDSMFPQTEGPWAEFIAERVGKPYTELSFGELCYFADYADFLNSRGRELVNEAKVSFHGSKEMHVKAAVRIMEPMEHKYRSPKVEDSRAPHYLRQVLGGWFGGLSLRNLLARGDGFREEAGTPGPGIHLFNGVTAGLSFATSLETRTYDSMKGELATLEKLNGKTPLPNTVAFPSKGYSEWNFERLVMACLNMGNEINMNRLRDGYGWTDKQIQTIASCLPAEGWDAIQKIWDALGGGELKKAVADTFYEENHYRMEMQEPKAFTIEALGKTVPGGYFPISYIDYQGPQPAEVKAGYSPQKLHADVAFTKRRDGVIKKPNQISLDYATLTKHIHEASYYAGTRMPLRKLAAFVIDDRYKAQYCETQSYERYKEMLDLVRELCNPAKEVNSVAETAMRWAKTVMVSTALMGKLKVVGSQFASISVGAKEIGSYWIGAAASPKGSLDFAVASSAMMAHRADLMDRDVATKFNAIGVNKFQKAQKAFARIGYFGMKLADSGVASIGWVGKYRQTIDNFAKKNSNLTLEERHNAAVAAADDFISRTQGSVWKTNLTHVQLSAIGRMLTPFIGPASAQFNTLYTDVGAYRAGAISGAEFAERLLYDMILPGIIVGFAGAALTAGFRRDDDDEGEPWWYAVKMFFRELFASPFSGVPFLRDLAGYASSYAINMVAPEGKKLYTGDVLDVGPVGRIADLVESLRAANDAVWDADWARASYKGAEFAGSIFHMPVTQIYTNFKNNWVHNGGPYFEWMENFDEAVKKKKGND